MAENLVILHTNDMHSNVRPEQLTKPGGMVRVKAAVDSIRRAEPYVMLLDAGDDVQGQMYFTLFKGEVEYEMMNRMGYDARPSETMSLTTASNRSPTTTDVWNFP